MKSLSDEWVPKIAFAIPINRLAANLSALYSIPKSSLVFDRSALAKLDLNLGLVSAYVPGTSPNPDFSAHSTPSPYIKCGLPNYM